ncbi:unnamed protein product [Notodromas monacha]|uniref:Protein FAM177A1 n=1 Tax=Notodromas monacha TaxID=399045 RepID=A0A7R9BZA1_9CRUS|nr:unnamed protein product [Notodromas monacha]CAG0923074.1 unnamed protein product [Notodromas monacha]
METKLEDFAPEKRVKKPKRVLHFSDGVLEEYSDQEGDELDGVSTNGNAVNEVALVPAEWGPWFWFVTTSTLGKLLSMADSAGGTLANFFGITSPKYQLEIDEFERMQQEDKEREEKLKEQMAGWESTETCHTAVVDSPISTDEVRITSIEGKFKLPEIHPKSDKWERY